MSNKWLIFFVFILLVLPLVNAKQPIPSSEPIKGGDITVVYPNTLLYPEDTTINLSFAVLNLSGFRLDNTTTECNYYINNNKGHLIKSGDLNYNINKYWNIELNSTYTTQGKFNIFVYCNKSDAAGYATITYFTNNNGLEFPTPGDYLIPISIALSIIGIVFIGLGTWMLITIEKPNRNGEPRMEWSDLVSLFFIYMGMLAFVILLHTLAINTTGDTQNLFNTVFTVYLYVYIFSFIFGVVGAIIQLLRWLAWSVNMPQWKKEEIRRK